MTIEAGILIGGFILAILGLLGKLVWSKLFDDLPKVMERLVILEDTKGQAKCSGELHAQVLDKIKEIEHNIDMITQEFNHRFETQQNKIDSTINLLLQNIESLKSLFTQNKEESDKFREENREQNNRLYDLLMKEKDD